MYNPFSLCNKTIFITGASSGIGRATAIECSKLGAKIIITGRDNNRLQQTFTELDGDGHMQFLADLTISDSLQAIVSELPKIDGFVCNAGIIEKKPIKFIKDENLQKVLSINSIVPIMLTKHLVKSKKLKNPSSVVYVSSIAGTENVSMGNSVYSASKGALHGFMKNAALELASKGVRCNSVNPGIITTKLLENTKLSSDQVEELRMRYPLKRFGNPRDVALAIIYLLSDAAAWVTGSALLIDGGFTLH